MPAGTFAHMLKSVKKVADYQRRNGGLYTADLVLRTPKRKDGGRPNLKMLADTVSDVTDVVCGSTDKTNT